MEKYVFYRVWRDSLRAFYTVSALWTPHPWAKNMALGTRRGLRRAFLNAKYL